MIAGALLGRFLKLFVWMWMCYATVYVRVCEFVWMQIYNVYFIFFSPRSGFAGTLCLYGTEGGHVPVSQLVSATKR